jgi:hypothetical protein
MIKHNKDGLLKYNERISTLAAVPLLKRHLARYPNLHRRQFRRRRQESCKKASNRFFK